MRGHGTHLLRLPRTMASPQLFDEYDIIIAGGMSLQPFALTTLTPIFTNALVQEGQLLA